MKPRQRFPLELRLRLKLETDATTGCWNFTGAKTDLGYGVIGSGGKGAPMLGAHRAAWQLWVGPIPEGHHIHHVCKNPSCCNPAHLQCVSPFEHKQVEDTSHANKATCLRGHPFSGDNLILVPKGDRLHRLCRECRNARARAKYRRDHPKPPARRPLKTHCKYGHPFSGDNLSPAALARGLRVCMACARDRVVQQRLRDVDKYRAYQRDYKRKDRARDHVTSPTAALAALG